MAGEGTIPNIDVPIIHLCDKTLGNRENDHFSVLLLREGYMVVTIDKNRHHVTAPAILCLNYNESIEVQKSGKTVLEGYSFKGAFISSSFTLDNIENRKTLKLVSEDMDLFWLNAFIKRSSTYYGVIPIGIDSVARVCTYFDKINREVTARDNIYWPCRTRASFMEMLFFIENKKADYESTNKVHFTSLNDELVEKVIVFINSNYHQPLRISDLCKKFAVNRTTLSERFVRSTGMTIVAYISSVRVQMACTMLKETYLPITEIMLESGFNSTANFNKSFKQQIGYTPREYRQNARSTLSAKA